MRGHPAIQMLVFALLWGTLAFPIWRLTRADDSRAAPVAETPAVDAEDVHTWVTLRFTQAPESVAVRAGGQVLLRATSPVPVLLETEAALPLAGGHAVLDVEVQWPEGAGEQVVEVTLEPDGLPEQSRHAWASGALRETWEFQWKR